MLALSCAAAAHAAAPDFPPINARPVSLAANIKNGTRLDAIRIRGMLEIPSQTVNGLRLAELSDLAWDNDDGILYAVTDQGALFGLRPVFKRGMLTDVRLAGAAPLREPDTGKNLKWRRTDGEGLDILHGRNGRRGDAELVVSFEVEPRILRYGRDGSARELVPLPKALAAADRFQSANRGLEALCVHPRLGILVMPEAPLRGAADKAMHVYGLNGKTWRLDSKGTPVALDCSAAGPVLILEREFSTALFRARATLREAALPAKPGTKPVTTRVLAELDGAKGHAVDNFEGLARHTGRRYFMVSDNNDIFLQRTLLLYFEVSH